MAVMQLNGPHRRMSRAGSLVFSLAKDIPSDDLFVVGLLDGEEKEGAGSMEFVTLCLEDWQAALNRGLDVLSFSAPPAFLTVCPNVFQPLFAQAVDDLDAVHGHAGYAENLSLLRRDPNAASEYFLARRYGPGLDVGDPVLVVTSRMTRP
ncbi:hypothetical protein X896_151 [Burkholderia pseudomallei ABCPW 1]|nr:hypothetical protein X896_151 [Burkholderia pseudomallei ABCPW 1]